MNDVYLAFRRLHVRNVNAQPAWWLVGPPGPLPYAGMAHALARTVCGDSARESGVAVVHHDFELLAERLPRSFAVHPHQFRGASLIARDDYASGTQLSLQPTVRGNLVASVIVRFPPGTQLREEPVRAWLRAGRLAGGTIQGAPDFKVLLSEQEAREFIRSGFSMHERSDLLQPRAGRDRLDALLAATRGDRLRRPTMADADVPRFRRLDCARTALRHSGRGAPRVRRAAGRIGAVPVLAGRGGVASLLAPCQTHRSRIRADHPTTLTARRAIQMTSQTVFDKTPSVFSFTRGLLVSDGLFYSKTADGLKPLPVVRHGIRGTQNVSAGGDSAAGGERDVSNIQQTETAKLDPQASALVVKLELRMLDLCQRLWACSGDTPEVTKAVRESVQRFAQRAVNSQGAAEVCRRMARMIANGSWLWRNRVAATALTVRVTDGEGGLVASYEGLKVPLSSFGDYSEAEQALAAVLLRGLQGDATANLRVEATVNFGVRGAVEVFPSQAYIEDKPTGFARPLYKVNPQPAARGASRESEVIVGQAALRDQKISNRLRTIDTWYPDFDAWGIPIPVEPNGASLDAMRFYRNGAKASAFGLLARLNTIDPDSADGQYCIASMIRGGVYSGGKKNGKAKAEAGAETAESSE